jgi:hypothetical protein
MEQSERSAQFWSVLVMAARTQQLLSYDMLEEMTGLPRFAQGKALGNILFYCRQKRLPLLPSIVLEQKTGRPGVDYPDVEDLSTEHRRVFIFDWLKHGCPKVEEFQEARDNEEAAVTV